MIPSGIRHSQLVYSMWTMEISPNRLLQKEPGDEARLKDTSVAAYLNDIPVLLEPPSTGELENTLTVPGLVGHVTLSFGSSKPPGVPTLSSE